MTSTATRTDIHRPSATEFDPADYEFVAVHDNSPEPGLGGNLAFVQLRHELINTGWTFSGIHGGLGKCDHCGAALRYSALMKHLPTRTLIYVGEQCLGNRFEMSKTEFQEARKQARLDRERQATLAAFRAACDENPALAWATYADNIEAGTRGAFSDWNIATQADIARKARQYGSVSPAQVRFLDKLVGELDGQLTKHIEREAAKAESGPAPTGRVAIEGTVTRLKDSYNDFGPRVVMTLVLDSGARVQGTAPKAIAETVETGSRVAFTATFTPGRDGDEDFAFFARPAKARLI